MDNCFKCHQRPRRIVTTVYDTGRPIFSPFCAECDAQFEEDRTPPSKPWVLVDRTNGQTQRIERKSVLFILNHEDSTIRMRSGPVDEETIDAILLLRGVYETEGWLIIPEYRRAA